MAASSVSDAVLSAPAEAGPVRLTLVIKRTPSGHDKKTKESSKKNPVVVMYTNPRDHFVLRAYRRLKETVSPATWSDIQVLLDYTALAKDVVKQLVVSWNKVPSNQPDPVGDTFLLLNRLSAVLPEQKHQVLETCDLVVDKTVKFMNLLQRVKTGVTEELADPLRSQEVFRLLNKVTLASEYRFSPPGKDAFLDDPQLQFFIFREGRITVFVIKDSTRWTSMVYHEDESIFPTSEPVTLRELEHMRSCWVRWNRGKAVGTLPADFEDSPKNVRRLVASTALPHGP